MTVDLSSLRILHYPDPILLRVAQPVEAEAEEVRAVARRMIEIMHEAEGVGLAAPQVGLPWRVFVTGGRDGDPVDRAFINPVLTLARGEVEAAEEGCLSLPGLTAEVRRATAATICAVGLDGASFTMEGQGMTARIWQHECDHLDGVLIIDRMSTMARLASRKLLKELRAVAGATPG
jgi:peptide deformylase